MDAVNKKTEEGEGEAGQAASSSSA
jgi:hypothetical protein